MKVDFASDHYELKLKGGGLLTLFGFFNLLFFIIIIEPTEPGRVDVGLGLAPQEVLVTTKAKSLTVEIHRGGGGLELVEWVEMRVHCESHLARMESRSGG